MAQNADSTSVCLIDFSDTGIDMAAVGCVEQRLQQRLLALCFTFIYIYIGSS